MFDLTGKVALLTGATGGIPRATAALCYRPGAVLALAGAALVRLLRAGTLTGHGPRRWHSRS